MGKPSPWSALKGQVLLGSEEFVEKIAPGLKDSAAKTEIPGFQRRLHRPALKKLLAGTETKRARNRALALAYLKHGYTLAEIGAATGLHYATVSRIVKDQESGT